MNESRLTEVYPDWMLSGIFTNLQANDVPWKDANISYNLNLAYYGSHSGDKIISPLVEKFLSADGTLSDASKQTIADIIFTMCSKNWSKLWDTLDLQYNPIENVDAYLTESTDSSGNRNSTDNIKSTGTDTHKLSGSDTIDRTGTNTHETSGTDTIDHKGTNTHATSGTDTLAHSGTDTHDVTGSDTTSNTGTVKNDGTSSTNRNQESGIAGFNSSGYSNADNQVTKEDQTVNNTETRNTQDSTTTTNKDTETVNLLDSTEYGKTDTDTINNSDSTKYGKTDTDTINNSDSTKYGRTDTETRDLTDAHTGNEQTSGKVSHELHRHGNIGVTTNQQMITAERELWDWYFYERVFKDIDKYLTIAVY